MDYTVFQCLETLTFHSDESSFSVRLQEAYRKINRPKTKN